MRLLEHYSTFGCVDVLKALKSCTLRLLINTNPFKMYFVRIIDGGLLLQICSALIKVYTIRQIKIMASLRRRKLLRQAGLRNELMKVWLLLYLSCVDIQRSVN